MSKPTTIELNDAFEATEKGNIWLAHNEKNWHNIWIRLGNNRWLQISIRPWNYPGLHVSVIQSSEKKLALRIIADFGGDDWTARKMNVEGVRLDKDGIVQSDAKLRWLKATDLTWFDLDGDEIQHEMQNRGKTRFRKSMAKGETLTIRISRGNRPRHVLLDDGGCTASVAMDRIELMAD